MSKPLTLFWPYSHEIMWFRSKLYALEIFWKKVKNQSLFKNIYLFKKIYFDKNYNSEFNIN